MNVMVQLITSIHYLYKSRHTQLDLNFMKPLLWLFKVKFLSNSQTLNLGTIIFTLEEDHQKIEREERKIRDVMRKEFAF